MGGNCFYLFVDCCKNLLQPVDCETPNPPLFGGASRNQVVTNVNFQPGALGSKDLTTHLLDAEILPRFTPPPKSPNNRSEKLPFFFWKSG